MNARCSASYRGVSPIVILIIGVVTGLNSRAQNVQRGEWEDVLKIVSADVENNFYDSHLKGLDWTTLTEETRQRIRNSNNTGQMILAICALLDKLGDSHTYFVPPPLTQQADFGFKAKAFGADIRIYEIESKGPAVKVGLAVGDKLLSLNRIPVDRTNISEILGLIERVVPSTSLDAEVLPPGGQAHVVHIAARMIARQEHQYLDSVWRTADEQRSLDYRVNFLQRDYGDGITYVAIPTFDSTPDSTYAAIKKAERSRAVILDLRGNHGGRVDTELAFLGFFSAESGILSKRISKSRSEDIRIIPRYSGFGGSIFVLVDSDSGSAAEESTRHLQMVHKALVVGDKTAGKVNEGRFFPGKIGAQFLMPFGVVVTEAKLVMPDGTELEGHGVIPDLECIPTAEDLRQQLDPCLDQAIALARKSLLDKSPRTN